ncbi:hypothetical protein OIE61_13855 [Streptomyces sp. NBC_01762]|uniref:hypothetical protein n=1 Tax=unclassified Streptomyces TaxID=2593676 RepID=UPI002DDA1A8C|nr:MULTISPECIES: hypothetical protein [unclassified Streptomyces]WSC50873.1 hypothetical protein OIE61_13855 [Streptomyces sp. NBC_01762]WSD30488.1 hypothetical protein OHA26_14590 [Streptomyces sp. NBC_01751]
MPRPARSVTGTAAAALTVAAIGFFTAAPSAYAGELGPLEIPPAAAASGDTVGTTASGSDTKVTGHANSLEAGVFALTPAGETEALADTFRVPEKTGAGKVTGQDDASGDDPGTGSKLPSLDDLAARGESLIGNANPFGLGTSTGQSDTPPERDTGSDTGRDTGNGERETGNGNGNGERETGNGNGDGGRDTGNGNGNENGGRDTGNGNGNGGHETGNGNGNGNGGRDTGNGNGGRDTGNGGRDTGNGDGGGGYDSPTGPSGHVKTGVGGSVRPDTTQIAAGVGVLAASAVGGAWLLRRRASGTQAGS